MDFQYALDLPYPTVDPAISPADARLLQENYGGKESETTAILQYMYQHYQLGAQNRPAFYDAIQRVAVVEMHHHELLGKAIVACGGAPMIGGNSCFWSGSSICYVKNARQMLQADIAGEERAIAGYRRTAALTRNPQIAALASRIIEDEELHLKIFRALLDCTG